MALIGAYAAYEVVLFAFTPALGGAGAFKLAIVARLGLLNLPWLIGLVAACEVFRLLNPAQPAANGFLSIEGSPRAAARLFNPAPMVTVSVFRAVAMGLAVAVGMRAIRRQINDLPVAHAAFGNDMVGELLHLDAASLQYGDFETAVVVEMNVQRRLGDQVNACTPSRAAAADLAANTASAAQS